MTTISHMRLRMELLAVGETLGWPRVGSLRAGQGNWERLARSPIQRVMPVLRHAKIRAENLGGEKESELTRVITFDDYVRYEGPKPPIKPAYTAEMRRANLAKARAARTAKKEAPTSDSTAG